MKIAAIICEFNPFSEGHKYLIDNVRQELNPDAVVCIMSGNYTQRGQIAIENKWKRANDAVKNGADLVVQMPVRVSLSSAKYFAKGATDIAKGLNADYLCFGSESGDLDYLREIASKGITGIESGNNILACEYLRCIGKMTPWTLKINETLGHASDKRNQLNNNYVNNLYLIERYSILTKSFSEISKASEVSEGLENRIVEVVSKAKDHDDLIKLIKSKRYNYSRISRILLQILLNINSSTVSKKYAHVLAFNEKGRKIIKSSKIKLYSSIKPKDTLSNKALREDVLSDDIYSVLTEKIIYPNSDYVCKPSKTNI